MRLRLSPTDSEIRKVDILEMNHPIFSEPTLGAVDGDDFYCVANSHGRVMRQSRDSILKGQLTPPAIVRIRLK